MGEVRKFDSGPLRSARRFDMRELWDEARAHGNVSLRWNDGEASCWIKRSLGNSTVETKFCRAPEPEQALHEAIQEAELWGLPLLPTPPGTGEG